MKYFLALASLSLALMWAMDAFYFDTSRESYDPRVTSEAFLRESRLGKILLKNSMVSISEDSHGLAIQDDCAETGGVAYGNFQNQFKVRAHITTPNITVIALVAIVQSSGESRTYKKEHITDPDRLYYDLNYKAAPGDAVYIKYKVKSDSTATLIDAEIQSRFTTLRRDILKNGVAVDTVFSSINSKEKFEEPTGPSILMTGNTPEITQYLPPEFRRELYAVGQTRKDSAFCTYIARQFDVGGENAREYDSPRLLPRVNITTQQSDLYGESGILDNKHGKGRWWEKPASLSVSNQNSISNQKVSLRFHGGTPGRKKSIESFRVYARKKFGVSTISAAAITGKAAEKDFKTLVLKYTFQSLRTEDVVFNPFIHSLALDVADEISAIVPRHHLVDLTINGQHKGLYLAMEHLSDRTIAHWLGHEDFLTFTYKSPNSLEQAVPLFSLAKTIMSLQGEQTLETLTTHMDLSNVINSILLTAYIGDDDYCQGVEVITEEEGTRTITSINWDLDHAFFTVENDQPYIDPDKYAFRPINLKKSGCARQRIFGWTYLQSENFRTLIRTRMEELLQTSLSPENAVKLMDYYKALNEAEFSGRYAEAISDLEGFLSKRADSLRRQLREMERNAEQIDISEKVEGW